MNATNANPEGAGTEARLPDVEITSAFWRRYIDLVIDKVLPYQWSVLNGEREVDLPPDPGGNPVDAYDKLNHSIRNLRVAAGEEDAPFRGHARSRILTSTSGWKPWPTRCITAAIRSCAVWRIGVVDLIARAPA